MWYLELEEDAYKLARLWGESVCIDNEHALCGSYQLSVVATSSLILTAWNVLGECGTDHNTV